MSNSDEELLVSYDEYIQIASAQECSVSTSKPPPEDDSKVIELLQQIPSDKSLCTSSYINSIPNVNFRNDTKDKEEIIAMHMELLKYMFIPTSTDTQVHNALECIRINIQNYSHKKKTIALWKMKLLHVLLFKCVPSASLAPCILIFFKYVYDYTNIFFSCTVLDIILPQLITVSEHAMSDYIVPEKNILPPYLKFKQDEDIPYITEVDSDVNSDDVQSESEPETEQNTEPEPDVITTVAPSRTLTPEDFYDVLDVTANETYV